MAIKMIKRADMKKTARHIAVAAIIILLISLSGCGLTRAPEESGQGDSNACDYFTGEVIEATDEYLILCPTEGWEWDGATRVRILATQKLPDDRGEEFRRTIKLPVSGGEYSEIRVGDKLRVAFNSLNMEQNGDEVLLDTVFTLFVIEAGIADDIEIFGLTPSDNGVDDFLEQIGEVPSMYENDTCCNIIPADIREKYGIDVFKYDQSGSSYILFEDTIYSVGASFGGFGITVFALADINGDGQKELYFTSSWGSGMHRSQVGFFDPAVREVTFFAYENFYSEMAFRADNGTLRVCNARIESVSPVDITVTPQEAVGTITFEDNKITFNLTDSLP